MSWTDERIALLKKMWKEGKSAAEIAKMLGKGVTRNAVIGKAHRMGLSGRPSPIKKPAAAPKKEKEAAPKKEAVKETRSSKSAPAPSAKINPAMAKEVEELKKIEKEVLPLNGGIPLIDLTERMCKWPIGDPKEDDFTFCGRGIRPGTPYCPDHAAMAYQTSSRSRSPMAANDRSRKAPVKEAVVAEVEEEEVEDVVEEDDEEVTA
jgi:GcrA cell cycle regulator